MSMNNFEILGLLGTGSYAQVFRVCKKNEDDANTIYALKRIVITDTGKHLINTEESILSRVEHTFVVRLIDSFRFENTFNFVLEYVSGGTLGDLLRSTGTLEKSAATFYMKEMVVALEYLHSEDIVHGDITPENVLLDATGHIKITDFGISEELVEFDDQKFAIDWRSLAGLFYHMVTGAPITAQNKWPKTLAKKARELLKILLHTEQEESFAAEAIKNSKYFKNTTTCWDEVELRIEQPPFIPPFKRNTPKN